VVSIAEDRALAMVKLCYHRHVHFGLDADPA
jgi:hypothetical protein